MHRPMCEVPNMEKLIPAVLCCYSKVSLFALRVFPQRVIRQPKAGIMKYKETAISVGNLHELPKIL